MAHAYADMQFYCYHFIRFRKSGTTKPAAASKHAEQNQNQGAKANNRYNNKQKCIVSSTSSTKGYNRAYISHLNLNACRGWLIMHSI